MPGPAVLLLDTNGLHRPRGGAACAPALRDVPSTRRCCSTAAVALWPSWQLALPTPIPAHPGWPALRDHYTGLFASVPATRLLTPDAQTWADAGLIAGTLARTQRFQPHQRKECLNDALIFLTAAKAGLPVLTANRGEFDLIQQLAPEVRFIHY